VPATTDAPRRARAAVRRSGRPGHLLIRPGDWYFYFLFYLLRIFKWPDSVFLGTIGVPTIGSCPLALPFMDIRRDGVCRDGPSRSSRSSSS